MRRRPSPVPRCPGSRPRPSSVAGLPGGGGTCSPWGLQAMSIAIAVGERRLVRDELWPAVAGSGVSAFANGENVPSRAERVQDDDRDHSACASPIAAEAGEHRGERFRQQHGSVTPHFPRDDGDALPRDVNVSPTVVLEVQPPIGRPVAPSVRGHDDHVGPVAQAHEWCRPATARPPSHGRQENELATSPPPAQPSATGPTRDHVSTSGDLNHRSEHSAVPLLAHRSLPVRTAHRSHSSGR